MTRILRLQAVMERVGYSRTQIYEKVKNGTFPRQVKLGDRAVGWPEHEIEAFLSKRIAARDEVAA